MLRSLSPSGVLPYESVAPLSATVCLFVEDLPCRTIGTIASVLSTPESDRSFGAYAALWTRGFHRDTAAYTEASQAVHEQSKPLPSSLLSAISAIVQDRLSVNSVTLESHGKDESYRDSVPPQAVVYPETTEEVSEVSNVLALFSALTLAG